MARRRTSLHKKKNSRRVITGFQGRLPWIIAGVVFFILLQFFVFQDEGLYRLIQLRKDIKEMEAHIENLELEKQKLEEERDRLLNDPEYLERIARERFRMAKPGEKVFHVIIERKKESSD